MASLQRYSSRGRRYWRLVESYRRPDGRPGIRVLEHLGKADDLLARLKSARPQEIYSVAAGAVDAAMHLATEFQVAATIDAALQAEGVSQKRDGLSVGESLVAAAVARLCHPSSKRAIAAWAKTTSLPRWLGVDAAVLTSQHFWDQMDAVPAEAIAEVEHQLVSRVINREGLRPALVAYDTTNFYTHLATTNDHSQLAQRGRNKQHRDDLRQVGLALMVAEDGQIPLGHVLYEGARPDVRTFAALMAPLRKWLQDLVAQPTQLTLVFDQGAESAANLASWRAGESTGLAHYVTVLKPSDHRRLLAEAAPQLAPVALAHGDIVQAWRGRAAVHGVEQTVVVVWSKRLADGQRRGLEQQITRARKEVEAFPANPRGGIDGLRRRASGICTRQYLREVGQIEVTETPDGPRARLLIDEIARHRLETQYFGLRVLTTTRDDWATAQIIDAYRGQAVAERAFRDLKDPWVCAFRPQHHWTDQKLRVHALIAVLALLLGRVLLRRAQQRAGFQGCLRHLVESLSTVRRAVLIYDPVAGGRPRVIEQSEACDSDARTLAVALGALAAESHTQHIQRRQRK
ncbi:MAG TPA: IS1634 family transposase [Pseudolabrys sp.]|nr:IS1634 family transposase [Pseudolabrys sp.]